MDSIGGENGSGLSISDIDQAIYYKSVNIENELANAELVFVEDSIVIKGLQARLDKLNHFLLKIKLNL